MKKPTLLLLGGNLGSGKTTAMVALAKELKERGYTCASVTNDFGEMLIDTEYAQHNGLAVEEFPNGCMCHFPDALSKNVQALLDAGADFILLEPIGSCYGTVGSIYGGLKEIFGDTFDYAPASMMVDPARYRSICMEEGENSMTAGNSYGYKCQLEEADIFLVTKIDAYDAADTDAVVERLKADFPDKAVISISSLEGTNIDAWADYVLSHGTDMHTIDIDIDYVMGIAASDPRPMPWYNARYVLESDGDVDVAEMGMAYLDGMRDAFNGPEEDIMHMKVAFTAGDGEGLCRCALTNKHEKATCTGDARKMHGAFSCNVNVRVTGDTDKLLALVEDEFMKAAEKFGVQVKEVKLQHLDGFADSMKEPPTPVLKQFS